MCRPLNFCNKNGLFQVLFNQLNVACTSSEQECPPESTSMNLTFVSLHGIGVKFPSDGLFL